MPYLLSWPGAINIINYYFPKFPLKLKIPDNAHPQLAQFIQKATVPSAIILGILVGLYEFPCTGGPYLMILGLLHDKASFIQGLIYLLYYNVIFVAPLIAILWFASQKAVCMRKLANGEMIK